MNMDSLRDLLLSGVKWELNDNTSLGQDIDLSQVSKPGHVTPKESTVLQPANARAIVTPIAPVNAQNAAALAISSALAASDWKELCAAIVGFSSHPLQVFAKRTILPECYKNNTAKKLVVITDSVSTDDEESGRVLSGLAGDLFDKMMGAIGLSRNDLAIVPLVFWRTPGGRTPLPEELEIARPFVKRAIELINPDAILTLGTVAAMEIADAKLPKQHGEQMTAVQISLEIPVFPTYHPNYLILKPDAKRDVWTALQKLQQVIFA